MTTTPEPVETVTRRCGNCGREMNVPTSVARDAASSGAALVHAECPGTPIGERHFEVTCTIRERQLGRDDNGQVVVTDTTEDAEVLAEFVADVRAADVASGMRPLALALGEKWARVEAQASVIDPDPLPVTGTVEDG